MKVKIQFSVDIDPDSWVLNYDIDRDNVRQDVKEYCEYMVTGHLELLGLTVNQDTVKG